MAVNKFYLDHLLFAGYLILFSWLVTKVRFFTKSGLTASQLIIFFLLKIIAGIIYGWIGIYYGDLAQMVDTWAYHYASLKEVHLLKTDPEMFLNGLFQNSYSTGYSNFLGSQDSWWNDLKSNTFLLFNTIFNFFSFGNYYINVIFYSFITLFGPVAIYRIMHDVFPRKKIAVLLGTFLIPSVLYWTSGLHKEGLIFTATSLIVYEFYFGFRTAKFNVKRIVVILPATFMILALRNFLILPLLPAVIAWFLSEKLKYKPILIYGTVYLIFFAAFFGSSFFPGLNLPQAVVDKQEEFLKLQGESSVNVYELKPTFASFVKNAPQALSLSILRPYPGDVRHVLSLAACIEIILILLLFVIFFFWKRDIVRLSPFLLFCIFFSFSVLMMIGYSVNVLGAIVRYRSIVLCFLVIPVVAEIDWARVKGVIFGNIDNKINV